MNISRKGNKLQFLIKFCKTNYLECPIILISKTIILDCVGCSLIVSPGWYEAWKLLSGWKGSYLETKIFLQNNLRSVRTTDDSLQQFTSNLWKYTKLQYDSTFQNKSVMEISLSCAQKCQVLHNLKSKPQILWQFLAVVSSNSVFRNTLYIFIHS